MVVEIQVPCGHIYNFSAQIAHRCHVRVLTVGVEEPLKIVAQQFEVTAPILSGQLKAD